MIRAVVGSPGKPGLMGFEPSGSIRISILFGDDFLSAADERLAAGRELLTTAAWRSLAPARFTALHSVGTA